jgi:hypothetical protein
MNISTNEEVSSVGSYGERLHSKSFPGRRISQHVYDSRDCNSSAARFDHSRKADAATIVEMKSRELSRCGKAQLLKLSTEWIRETFLV